MIVNTHHTGFVVEDLEKAIDFYCNGLGFEISARFERTGPPIQQVVGYESAHLKLVLLTLGNEHFVELIQYLSPTPIPKATNERNAIGSTHLAFLVDDIFDTFEHLKKCGANIMNPPTTVSEGRVACYLQDPDGNWLELLQLS
jgi:lactoylglutathione lyase